MESLPFIEWCLENLTYPVIVLLMAIESSFIPFPSELVVPPAAYKAAAEGDQNLALIVLAASIGSLIGALVNYGLSVWLGRPLVYRFAESRLGHMCLIDRYKVEKAEKYFNDHGAIGTFVGRLVPAIRKYLRCPRALPFAAIMFIVSLSRQLCVPVSTHTAIAATRNVYSAVCGLLVSTPVLVPTA